MDTLRPSVSLPCQNPHLLRETRTRALVGVMAAVKRRGPVPFRLLPRTVRRHLLAGLPCQLALPRFQLRLRKARAPRPAIHLGSQVLVRMSGPACTPPPNMSRMIPQTTSHSPPQFMRPRQITSQLPLRRAIHPVTLPSLRILQLRPLHT